MARKTALQSALADDQPDGIYWRDEERNCYAVTCAHCAHLSHYPGRDAEFTIRALASHLWHGHGLRRVWFDRFDLSAEHAVQLAMPLVLDAEARANSRALRAVR